MDGLGTELPRRTSIAWTLLGVAVVMAGLVVTMAREAVGSSGGEAMGAWSMTAVVALLLVVGPAMVARGILVRRTYVSPEVVSVVRTGLLHQQVALGDLTEVRVRLSGQGGAALRNEKLFLLGPLRTGHGNGLLVMRFHVTTLRPLLDVLAAEVARRPDLLRGELERGYFEDAVRTAP